MLALHFKVDQTQEAHKCLLDHRPERALLLEDQVSSLFYLTSATINLIVSFLGHFPSPGPAGPGNFAGGQFGMPPGSPFHGPGPHPMQGGTLFLFSDSKDGQ